MDRFPEPGADRPTLAGASPAQEERVFQEIVRNYGKLPEGVSRVDFRFGEDSVGDPAVWIVFHAKDELRPSKESIAALRRAGEAIRSEIRRAGTERWPYITIEVE